ncbi:MAG: hypothetical protein ACI8T1_003974 [Verrucomicrobiales bacterium]|jgi:hypothetical protein
MKSSPLLILTLTRSFSLAALAAGQSAEILGYYDFEEDHYDSSDRPVIIEFELLSGADDDFINRADWFNNEIIVN